MTVYHRKGAFVVLIKSNFLLTAVAGILLCSCSKQDEIKYYYPTIKKSEILSDDVEVSHLVSFAEVDKKWKIHFVGYINLQDRKLDYRDCTLESFSLNFNHEQNSEILLMSRSKDKTSFINGKAFFSYSGQVNSPENFYSELHFQLNDKCGTKTSVFDYEAIFKPIRKKVSFLDRAFFG